MAEAGKFDNLFATAASNQGSGIEGLLDEFFGFLQRRTDFFTHEGHSLADVEGAVLKAVRKHHALGVERQSTTAKEHREKDEAARKKREAAALSATAPTASTISAAANVAKPKEAVPRIQEIFDGDEQGEEAQKVSDAIPKSACEADDDDEGDDDDDSVSPSKHGNGGVTDRYTWTQTLQSLDIQISVPPGTKGPMCAVEIKAGSLKVGLKGDSPIIDGKLHLKVKADDCYWTLVENKTIQVQLEKVDTMRWWSCVVEGDPEIDTKKIVPENSKLSELDGETRATVEKMMFDQQQKELGKPTSEQSKQLEMLEKLKKANPQMDFSKAKINFGGGSAFGGAAGF